MGKFPKWDRPNLRTGQLEAEDRRLALRGISAPEHVRADLIRAAAHHQGSSRTARLRSLAQSLNLSDAYPDNVLAGRLPLGPELLERLYGPGRGSSLPLAWCASVDDWGPLLPDALAAGVATGFGVCADILVHEFPAGPVAAPDPAAAEAAPHTDLPSAAGAPVEPAPAPAAAASSPPLAAAITPPAPAAAHAAGPAPELGQGKPAAGGDACSAAGEGSHTAALHAVPAGEGPCSDAPAPPPHLPPPPLVDDQDHVGRLCDTLAQLARLAQEAAARVQDLEGRMADLGNALVIARRTCKNARDAYDLIDALRQPEQVAA